MTKCYIYIHVYTYIHVCTNISNTCILNNVRSLVFHACMKVRSMYIAESYQNPCWRVKQFLSSTITTVHSLNETQIKKTFCF